MQLRQYAPERIRNVGLFAHGGAGKTSLAEALLFDSGALDRLGRVGEGTTASDHDPDEIRRHTSISAAVLPLAWRDHKINLIDAPGVADFAGDMRAALRVVDAAVILSTRRRGWRSGPSRRGAWPSNTGSRACCISTRWIARMPTSPPPSPARRRGSGQASSHWRCRSGRRARSEGSWRSCAAARTSTPAATANRARCRSLPSWWRRSRCTAQLIERIAECDDALIEKFLSDEPIEEDELARALKAAACCGTLVLALCGVATGNTGIQAVLDAIVDYLPAPTKNDAARGTAPHDSEAMLLSCDPDGPTAALVFKTVADRFGSLSVFRVYSGTVHADSHLLNASRGQDERLGQLQQLRGKEQSPTAAVVAGDIGAVVKLTATRTGDTLCDAAYPVVLPGIDFPRPLFSAALAPHAKGDVDKLGVGLAQLAQEDPTLLISRDPASGELLLSGLGESHIQVATERLARKSGVHVDVQLPRIPYRETIATAAHGVKYRHKKQTGGSGQFGEVVIDIDPLPEQDFLFAEAIVGGTVPRQYIPGVEKGVREALDHGPVADFPVVNVKVTLIDGAYHTVHSNEMAFKIASSQAFKEAMQRAHPTLLEPMIALRITVPTDHTGDIIGDLNAKRAHVTAANPGASGETTIEACVPLAEIQRYATALRQLTQGQGTFEMIFDHYQKVPPQLMEQIVTSARAAG